MELKIFLLFILPYFFLEKVKKNETIAVDFYKLFIVTIFLTTLFGFIVLNELRYTAIFGLSIYVSYIIAFGFFYFYNKINYIFILLIIFNLILLGSKMGLILFFLVIILKQESLKRKILLITQLPLFALGIYYYSLYFRGQDLLLFEDIDRFLITTATYHYMIKNFFMHNYFFGLGPGYELVDFKTSSAAFNTWFLYTFTHGHLFAYMFHNEYFRLIYSYGLVGFTSILYFLYKKQVPLILVLTAMLTNSILYSNSFIFFISLMISYTIQSNKKTYT